MISIEETYKEMGLTQKSNGTSSESDMERNSKDIGGDKNKSMTIIEEEDLEESQANLNMISQMSNITPNVVRR